MTAPTLWVPFSVLNEPGHSPKTRLIGLLLGSQAARDRSTLTDARLRMLSGLDLKTIARARARLAQAPLGPCYVKPHPSCAAIPEALLTAADISAGARLLYGQLQGVPNFADQGGSFTYAALSQLTGSSDEALRRAAAELASAGWLAMTQANRKSPVNFTLRNPVTALVWARLSSIRRKAKNAQYRGEALLREFLNAMVALDKYEDNAAPDLLLNPFTGELMELDRYYPTARVAFEFQGAQHDEVTDLAAYEDTVKQVGRDAMKAFICKTHGIELVLVHPEELRRKAIEQKIPERIPRRDLGGSEPLLALLDRLATEYRTRSTEERKSKNPRSIP